LILASLEYHSMLKNPIRASNALFPSTNRNKLVLKHFRFAVERSCTKAFMQGHQMAR
jgi:hypothetical protein